MRDSTYVAPRKGFQKLRALFMVLAFGFNLLLIPGVGLYLMNDEDYRHVLIWSADNLLDSQLEIDGAFSVSFGREVELSAETVRLRANDGSYDLSVGKLNLVQRFASYLSTGTLWIDSLSMEDLHAEIKETGSKQGSDGQAFSLPFVVIEQIQLRNLSLAYTEIDQQRHTIDLSHVSLDDTDNQGPLKVSAAGVMNTRTLQLDGTLGSLEQLRSMDQAYPIELTLLSGTVDGSSATRQGKSVIKLNGTVGSTPAGSILVEAAFDVDVPELVPIFSKEIVADKLGHLQGRVSVAEVGGRWRIRKTQFAATGTDAYQLRVDGAVENSGQFDLNSEFGVTDPAAFGARFGIDLSGYAPIKGKGLISGNKDRLNYQGKLSVGRIESETTLTASLVGDKPQIQGKSSVAELYLADIGINQRLSAPAQAVVTVNPDAGEQANPEAPTSVADTSVKANSDTGGQPKSAAQALTPDDSRAIFDRQPIDFSGLQQFNLDLEILVEQIIGEDFSIDKLAGQVKLNDGALRVTPMRMTFAGGQADLELVVDTRKTPSVSLKVTADDLQLGGVVPHQQEEMQVAGNVRLHVDLNSKGRSIDELFTNLSGDMGMGLVKVRLPRRYVEFLSGDEPRTFSASEAYTMLEIDGTIAAKFGTDIDLTAEAVHLRANDGSYDLSLGKMNLQQNIELYLQKGDLWIDNLSISDVKVEVIEAVNEPEDFDSGNTASEVVSSEQEPSENELPDHDWHEFDWQISNWPFVLVEKMQLDNITVVYTKGDETDNYSLSSLELDNDNSDEPLALSAAGIVNQLALKIEGTVGTPAEPRGKDQVYPVEYSLSSGAVGGVPNKPVFWFKGSIDRTQPGGSHIEGKFDVDVSELLSIVEPETPSSRLVSAVKQERTGEELGHLQGSLNFAEVDGRWGIKELHVVSSETDLYELTLDGSIDQKDILGVRTHIEIPDPPLFGEAFGIDLTGYAAYEGVGVLTGNRSQLDYKGQTSIGRTENELTLAISLVGGKPTIKGKFSSPDLYLPDIGINTFFAVEAGDDIDLETGKRKDSEEQTPQDDSVDEASLGTDEGADSEETVPISADDLIVFDREPFDFSWLQGFNLDMEILIDDITGVDFSLDQLAGQIKLTDGVLRVSPMRLTLEGGTTDLNLLLEIHDTPSFTLTVLADDLILGSTIAKVQDMVPVEGKAHLNVDIKSSGNSPHEMAANLSGETSFSLEEAKIPKVYVEYLSVDVMGWMARMVTFEDSYTTLHCVMTTFDVNQGVAKSRIFFAEGSQLSIGGDATLDLGQETMDMTLLPKQKKRIAASTSTIRISGPLADPDFETSTSKGAATVAVGGAVLAPQIVIPIFLVEQLWKRVFSSSEKDTGCADYIEQHEAQKPETQQQQAEQQTTEQQKARQQNAKQQKAEQQKAGQQKARQQKARQQKAGQQKARQQKAGPQKAE